MARSDSFEPLPIEAAADLADIIMMLLPDEIAPAVYSNAIEPKLKNSGCGMPMASTIRMKTMISPVSSDQRQRSKGSWRTCRLASLAVSDAVMRVSARSTRFPVSRRGG